MFGKLCSGLLVINSLACLILDNCIKTREVETKTLFTQKTRLSDTCLITANKSDMFDKIVF